MHQCNLNTTVTISEVSYYKARDAFLYFLSLPTCVMKRSAIRHPDEAPHVCSPDLTMCPDDARRLPSARSNCRHVAVSELAARSPLATRRAGPVSSRGSRAVFSIIQTSFDLPVLGRFGVITPLFRLRA